MDPKTKERAVCDDSDENEDAEDAVQDKDAEKN